MISLYQCNAFEKIYEIDDKNSCALVLYQSVLYPLTEQTLLTVSQMFINISVVKPLVYLIYGKTNETRQLDRACLRCRLSLRAIRSLSKPLFQWVLMFYSRETFTLQKTPFYSQVTIIGRRLNCRQKQGYDIYFALKSIFKLSSLSSFMGYSLFERKICWFSRFAPPIFTIQKTHFYIEVLINGRLINYR